MITVIFRITSFISINLVLFSVIILKSNNNMPEDYKKLDVRKELTDKLFKVAENGQPELVRELARSGADVNAQDTQGNTPLHYAAKAGIAGIAQELLANGANPTVKNSAGNTALDVASNEYQRLMNTDEAKASRRLFRKIPTSQKPLELYLNEQKLDQFKRTLSVLFGISEQ